METEIPKIKNGFLTLLNTKTGKHRTFRIQTVRQGGMKGSRLLGLLIGPNNESDYQNFAFVNPTGIALFKKFRADSAHPLFSQDIPPGSFEKFAKMIWAMAGNTVHAGWYQSRGIEMSLSGTCCRCNRLLTDPESIRLGIGPECRKIKSQARNRLPFRDDLDHPF